MIRGYIPTLYESDFGSRKDQRAGDCTVISDDRGNVEVIDGYCGRAAERVIEYLKDREYKSPWLTLTHSHYDHRDGIERIISDGYFTPRGLQCQDPASIDKGFSGECAEEVRALEKIISKARARDIPVIYRQDGEQVVHGDLSYIVYRNQPKTARNTDAYLNDGSLCYWFPFIKYLTTGDAGLECAKQHGLAPVYVKGGHHGNDLVMRMANYLWESGCRFYWDNDYSETLTDFLMTGRENAQAVGMRCLSVHGDINFIAYGGKVVIYKGAEHWSYRCGYSGALMLKSADLSIVKAVLRGDCGKMDGRITTLINTGYAPVSVQNNVNEIYRLVKG